MTVGSLVRGALFSVLLAGCTGESEPAGAVDSVGANEATAAPHVCPPCGMKMAAGAPLVEIAGRRWAACNDRCAEIIAGDPAAFLRHAVDE